MRRKSTVLVCVALLGLALAQVAPAADPAGLSPRGPDSPNASRIEDVYWLLVAVTGAIFVLVEAALIWFLIRFRSRGRPRTAEGPQIHGATRLELIWTAMPVVILAVIAAFVLYKLPGINGAGSARAGTGDDNALRVNVVGHQFYWNFIYPNGVIQVARLRIPAQRPIELEIASADVDHSWWIPSLQGKFDAIPGLTNRLWFRAERTGTYKGQCGEFCGYEHAHMLATVEALPSGSFDSWYARERRAQESGTSNLGRMTFEGACATCHGMRGQGGFGPQLQGNPVLDQPDAIRTLVLNGRGKMPAVGHGWQKRQMDALIAYLKRLPGGGGGG